LVIGEFGLPAIVETLLQAGGQKPEDIAALLIEFIAASRSSLHIAIYDFRLHDPVAGPVIQALRDRAAAGMDVRIAYDAGKPNFSFRQASADPAPPGTAAFVNRIGGGVQGKGITGGDPQMPKLMHHKYLVRDGNTPAGTVWTGSTNFTEDSWAREENNIVQVASPELCTYYETDFDELWTSGDIATTGARDHGAVSVGPASIEVAFAPGEGRAIDHEIAHYIGMARRRLKVCSMIITSGAILGALCDALSHGRVADYGGVYDRTQMQSVFDQWRGTPSEWKIHAFHQVAGPLSGKVSTPFQPGSPHDFMHNKIVVADDRVITGSYNLSNSATVNAENVLMIRDADLADPYCAYIDRLAERYRS
jgi:phosphatidylserine/phosphatidylglycerophosphate/cardiolipin synthase-like enzyme